MNFLSMQYFLEIAKNGNISNTAKQLYISQQTLSEHIQKLEEELGTPLFKRTRPLTLTHAGRRFLQGAQEALAVMDETAQDIRNIVIGKRERIFVGEATCFNPPFMSALIRRFSQEYPEYEIVIRSIAPENIARDSDIDLVFLDMHGSKSLPLDSIPITDNEQFMIMVRQSLLDETFGKDWPRIETKLKETQNLFLLRNLPYIMPRDNQSRNIPLLEKAFEHAGFRPKTVFRSERNGLNIEMCLNGTGAYVGPMGLCIAWVNVQTIPYADLRMFPITIPHYPAPRLALGYHKGKHLSEVEQSFIEMTKIFIKENEASFKG